MLTAAQVDNYLQEQTVMVFATAAARDAALTTAKSEGMVTYQVDTNTLTVYSGAAWSTIGPAHGALTSWTPAVTQAVSVTCTTSSQYQRVGRWVSGFFYLTVTGAGTAANPVNIACPVTNASPIAPLPCGVAYIFDSSANTMYNGVLSIESSSLFGIRQSGGVVDPRFGVTLFTAGLASSDTLVGTFSYLAAADA